MFVHNWKACTKTKALVQSKQVHAHLAQRGSESTRCVGEFVMSTLVNSAGLEDALQVFHRLPNPNVRSWTAVISSYTAAGKGHEALRMYEYMQKDGIQPNKYTFVGLLKACGSITNLEKAKYVHAEALRYHYETDIFVGTCLISTYAKCGNIVEARNIFDGLQPRSVVSWTAMLAAYNQVGQAKKALWAYEQMHDEGVSPNAQTFVAVLQACGLLAEDEEDVLLDGRFTKLKSLNAGKAIHVDIQRKGYLSDPFVGSTLISMYGKCGSILDAQYVFDGLSQRNVVAWTAMLAAYAQQGQPGKTIQLYEQMQEEAVSPNARTLVSALQSCGMLAEMDEDGRSTKLQFLAMGKAIHARVQSSCCHTDIFVCSTLISMYGRCGSISDAQIVFDGIWEHSIVSWNAMLAAYVQQHEADKALHLYKHMQEKGESPNARTIVTVLQACGRVADTENLFGAESTKVKSLKLVKAVHAYAGRKSCASSIFVGNKLVSAYGKCGSIKDAQIVFDGLSNCSVVSWTAMLAAYAEQEQAKNIFTTYEQMLEKGVSSDDRVLVILLQACGMLAEEEEHVVVDGEAIRVKSLAQGKAVHGYAFRNGYTCDTFVGNALVTMYGKCGSISDAWNVFAGLCHRDVVSWNAILAVHARHGQVEKVLQLYRQIQEEGISVDDITFVCVLQAGCSTGSLDLCRQIHQTVVSFGKVLIPLVANTLIYAYGRCASMVDAKAVFDALPKPDVVSWTALISGYSREGNWVASLQCYEKMRLAQVKPNDVTFLSLLSACSHAGLVDKAVEYFESMTRDHGITPKIEHYASMIDLLGRAGHLEMVEQLMSSMPMQPDLSIWLSLLSACRNLGKVSLGKQAYDNAVQLQPQDAAAYVLILNIYTDAGLWELAKEVKESQQKAGAWKKPGQSWIRNDEQVHNFMVADRRHPQHEALRGLMEMLGRKLAMPLC